MTEKWGKIPGYGGLYSASTLGNIRRDDTGRVLAGTITKRGYRQHHLSVESNKATCFAHTLVLLAFAGPCPDGMEGCHNNGNSLDNRSENLRWDTHLANLGDRKAQGNYAVGERHHASRLSEEQATAILADPRPTALIASNYGVSMDTVGLLKRRKTWRHLTGPVSPLSGKKAKFHHPDHMEAAKRSADRRKA